MNEFNYTDSLNRIKASLFDIYENQEQEIGLEQNEAKRNSRLTRFIEVKDIALMLIEGINDLYDDSQNQTSTIKNELENPQMPSETEESKILDMVENSNIEDIDTTSDDIQDSFNEEELDIEGVFDIDTEESKKLKKYYLDCSLDDVNFAYVPQGLYEKIKNSNSLISKENTIEDNYNDESEEIEDSIESQSQRFIKQDEEKPRGIIVRSDQYMKLALSKHRQEGVLTEARKYHIQETRKKRREKQKKELEKAAVKIDI